MTTSGRPWYELRTPGRPVAYTVTTPCLPPLWLVHFAGRPPASSPHSHARAQTPTCSISPSERSLRRLPDESSEQKSPVTLTPSSTDCCSPGGACSSRTKACQHTCWYAMLGLEHSCRMGGRAAATAAAANGPGVLCQQSCCEAWSRQKRLVRTALRGTTDPMYSFNTHPAG